MKVKRIVGWEKCYSIKRYCDEISKGEEYIVYHTKEEAREELKAAEAILTDFVMSDELCTGIDKSGKKRTFVITEHAFAITEEVEI